MKTIMLALFAVLSTLRLSYGQSAEDKIDLRNFNQNFFTGLLFEEVNKLRDSLGKHRLHKDSVLDMAARNQALYISKTDDISHLQKDPLFANPEKRVEYFKGTHEKVGEIIEVIYLDKPTQIYKETNTIKIQTYAEAVNFFIKNNVNTSDHFELQMEKSYYHVGFGYGVNEDRKCIYITNLYASKPFKYHQSVKDKAHKKTFYPSKKLNIDNAYGIKPYDQTICSKCIENYNTVPASVKKGLYVENGKIYFQFSDLALFEKTFPNGTEAIAVDVVHLDQFPCEGGNILHRSPIFDGILFKPMLKSEILKNNLRKDKNEVLVVLGNCPYENVMEYELSLLLINQNALCSYYHNAPDPVHKIQLIDTELYSDTLSKKEIVKKRNTSFSIVGDNLKNDYTAEDVLDIYDSLKLSKYIIKELTVLNYMSIEKKNDKVYQQQKKRAENIAKYLQSFQKDSIKIMYSHKENWDQLYKDVKGTSMAYLANIEKDAVKERIQKSDSLNKAIEPSLKKQRRITLAFKLVEKIDLTTKPEELVDHFKTAVKKKDMANASLLQSALFDAVTTKKITYYQFETVEIPKTKEFAQLLNNNLIFRYNQGLKEDYIAELEKISALDPSNNYVKFNIANLTLKGWADTTINVTNPDPIIKNIKALLSSKLDKKLVNQLYLNYYILVSDFYKRNNKIRQRDEALAIVKKYQKTFDATQKDVVSLAGYYAYHGYEDYAMELVKPYIDGGEYSEDLLFYYLSLNLDEPENYETYSMVSLMKKAKEMNAPRFCELYGTNKVSFQIFKNEDLKKMYCESCRPQ